jgi:hypothetical protein
VEKGKGKQPALLRLLVVVAGLLLELGKGRSKRYPTYTKVRL